MNVFTVIKHYIRTKGFALVALINADEHIRMCIKKNIKKEKIADFVIINEFRTADSFEKRVKEHKFGKKPSETLIDELKDVKLSGSDYYDIVFYDVDKTNSSMPITDCHDLVYNYPIQRLFSMFVVTRKGNGGSVVGFQGETTSRQIEIIMASKKTGMVLCEKYDSQLQDVYGKKTKHCTLLVLKKDPLKSEGSGIPEVEGKILGTVKEKVYSDTPDAMDWE